MTPHTTLIVSVKIQGLRESESVWVRKNLLLPFVPSTGAKIQLWREDGETKELDLVNVVYSMKDSCFTEEQEDDTIREALEAEEEEAVVNDAVEDYKSFGFVLI